MSSGASLRKWIVTLAVAAVLNPALPLGAGPPIPKSSPTREVPDVALDNARTFHGVVVDGQGQPSNGIKVSLARLNPKGVTQRWTTTVTDDRGRFEFGNLVAGTHRVETSSGAYLCRLWTHDAAPPAAAPALLVVNDSSIERGQRPIGEILYSDPLLMATVVAAAIAIPIAVHKSRDDSPEGS